MRIPVVMMKQFKCEWLFWAVECKKTIAVASARDHDQELYCKTCHGRLFGPKGYGFAGGAGTMLSMDTGKCGDTATEYAVIVFNCFLFFFFWVKDNLEYCSVINDKTDF